MVHEGHLDVVLRAARSRVTARDRLCVNNNLVRSCLYGVTKHKVKTEMRIKDTKQIKHNN